MAESAGYPNVVAGRSADDNTPTDILMDPTSYALYTGVWVWNASSLIWEKMTQPKTSDTANNYVWNGAAWVEEEQAKTTDNVEIYGYNGTNWQTIKIDTSTRAINTISYEHHEIHGGSAYFAIYSATANNTGSIGVRIQTPDNTKWAHMVIEVESALAGTAELWYPTTMTDVVGNRITPMNRNHNSANTSGLTICHTPGGSQAGTANLTQYIGASASGGRVAAGGGASSRHEFILDQNNDYYIKATSRADNNALSIILDWYEHTDNAA